MRIKFDLFMAIDNLLHTIEDLLPDKFINWIYKSEKICRFRYRYCNWTADRNYRLYPEEWEEVKNDLAGGNSAEEISPDKAKVVGSNPTLPTINK